MVQGTERMKLRRLSISAPSVRRSVMAIRSGQTLALALLFAAPAYALQPLEVFVAAAGQHNPDALESQANVELQRAQTDVALGRVLPGISARGTITRNQF